MSSDWITGGELLDGGVQLFELTAAIREERISCTDPVSGRPVLDVNTSRAVPKYQTLSQALIAYRDGCRRTGMSTNVQECEAAIAAARGTTVSYSDEEKRDMRALAQQADENCARVVLKEAVTYPAGTHQFDFDGTKHRDDVDGFVRCVRALLFPRVAAAACFPQVSGGHALSASGQDVAAIVAAWREFMNGADAPQSEKKQLKIEMLLTRIEYGLSVSEMGRRYTSRTNVPRDLREAKVYCGALQKQFPSLPTLPERT